MNEDEIAMAISEISKNSRLASTSIAMSQVKRIDLEVNSWLRSDIEKIVKMCQQEEIKIILQNYPLSGTYNKVIKEIAEKNSIPFIDHCYIFKNLLSKEKVRMEDYFKPDTHCNEKGYGIMAENIYNKIIEESLISFDER